MTTTFLTPEAVRNSLFAILNSKSLRACAQRHHVKENELRAAVLAIPRSQSIPDLRSPQWQRWGDPQTISKAANYARWLCQQSEQKTGIYVAHSLEAREAKIAAQFMKELI